MNKPLEAATKEIHIWLVNAGLARSTDYLAPLAHNCVLAYLRAALEDWEIVQAIGERAGPGGMSQIYNQGVGESAIQVLIDHIADANKMVKEEK